jgi:hypothetical protein
MCTEQLLILFNRYNETFVSIEGQRELMMSKYGSDIKGLCKDRQDAYEGNKIEEFLLLPARKIICKVCGTCRFDTHIGDKHQCVDCHSHCTVVMQVKIRNIPPWLDRNEIYWTNKKLTSYFICDYESNFL